MKLSSVADKTFGGLRKKNLTEVQVCFMDLFVPQYEQLRFACLFVDLLVCTRLLSCLFVCCCFWWFVCVFVCSCYFVNYFFQERCLCLALQLISRPLVLFLDEPMSGIVKIRSWVRHLNNCLLKIIKPTFINGQTSMACAATLV